MRTLSIFISLLFWAAFGWSEVAYFLAPYKKVPNKPRYRYCAMDDFTKEIIADGGSWDETEVLGNQAIVKVKASTTTLSNITNAEGFYRFPLVESGSKLKTIDTETKNVLKDKLTSAGYTAGSVLSSVDFSTATFRDYLGFMASKRKEPRWDDDLQDFVMDGKEMKCKSIDAVDNNVK